MAVERNKIRRRLKEIIRRSDLLPSASEVVFCISRPCGELSFDILKETCEWAFGRISRASVPGVAVS